MYENQTYERILYRAMNFLAPDVDNREGSLIMNAVAPVSAEHANIYILLDNIIRNGYADTALREYLILRCKERGIYPYEATKSVLKGKFNMEIPLNSRFSLNELNYKAISSIDSEEDGVFYYQMECETAGTQGNKYFGALTPIEYIDKDLEGALIELLIPAEDEEDTEALRERYFNSFESNPFGGNKQDYKDKTKAIDGVGGVIVVPVHLGGGTVKLIIIDSDFNKASETLVERVQNAIDPSPKGTGSGIAPIGHTVTVVSADEKPIDVSFTLQFNEGYSWDKVETAVTEAIEAYLLEMRKVWEDGNLVVRTTQIETRLLDITGIMDVAHTKINNSESNLVLATNELPVLRGVTHNNG